MNICEYNMLSVHILHFKKQYVELVFAFQVERWKQNAMKTKYRSK